MKVEGRTGCQRLALEAIARHCLQGYSLAEDATSRGYHWRLLLDTVHEAVP